MGKEIVAAPKDIMEEDEQERVEEGEELVIGVGDDGGSDDGSTITTAEETKKHRLVSTTNPNANCSAANNSDTSLSTAQEDALGAIDQSVTDLIKEARGVVEARSNFSGDSGQHFVSYEKLHMAAKSAHRCIVDAIPFLSDGRNGNITNPIGPTRKSLQSSGQILYSLVRGNPLAFRDSSSPSLAAEVDGDTLRKENQDKIQQDPLQQQHQGAASAYVRHVSATLVLIHCFRFEDNYDRELQKKPSLVASQEQLTFGLVTFVRAGRAMMNFAENPVAAYDTLFLAIQFWKELQKGQNQSTKNEHHQKHLNEAFDAYSLLPDAAYLVHTYVEEKVIGSPHHLLQLIDDLNGFVQKHCHSHPPCSQQNQTKYDSIPFTSTPPILCIEKFLPTLARLAYKHGNRFARESDLKNAQNALTYVLNATERCLAEIRLQIVSLSVNKTNSNDVTPFHLQELEMIILTKEALYVMAYVNQASNRFDEAHNCLEKIQLHIIEQCQRDEELYRNTISAINNDDGPESELSTSSQKSALILGPKRADEADIRTRAQSALAASKHAELKERANLAFTRIMIYQRSFRDEKECILNEQLDNLISLVGPSPRVAHLATEKYGDDDEIFELALTACRQILIQRLTKPRGDESLADGHEMDSYERLAMHLISLPGHKNGDHFQCRRTLTLELDRVSAILSSAQLVRESIAREKSMEGSSCAIVDQLSNRMQVLDQMAVEKAQSLTMIIQDASATEKKNNHPPSDFQAKSLLSFMQECRGHFSRALDTQRNGSSTSQINHSLCISWADLILRMTSMLSDLTRNNNITSGNSSQVTTSHSNDLITAEVMAVKALSLASNGEAQRGASCARIAWENACQAKRLLFEQPTLRRASAGITKVSCSYNLAALFHCMLLSNAHIFSSAEPERLVGSDSLLLELEDALSHLSSKRDRDDILDVFPTLVKSCEEIHKEGTGFVQLGIKEHWIKILMRSDKFGRALQLRHNKDSMPKEKDKNIGVDLARSLPSVFDILLSFLHNFETLLHKYLSTNTAILLRTSRSLDAILDEVINILIQVRDRCKSHRFIEGRKRRRKKKDEVDIFAEAQDPLFEALDTTAIGSNDESNYRLIWDDATICTVLGSYRDCVCIAEQLWNISSLLVANADAKVIAAELYTKAHDFALLSEEEEGKALSRGFLDFDRSSSDSNSYVLTPFVNERVSGCKKLSVSDLSSEFSAQCLLLAVANVADAHCGATQDALENIVPGQHKDLMRKTMRRLELAYNELLLNRPEEHRDRDEVQFKHFVILLAIRCAVESGDDSECVNFLSDEETLKHMFIPCEEECFESSPATEDNIPTLDYIYVCSRRAEANRMKRSSWILLHLCCRELARRRQYRIDYTLPTGSNIPSLGDMQQKLIRIAPSVEKILSVFGDVNKTLNACSAGQHELSASIYSGPEMDWFAVEAYNRGVNLTFIGDVYNAERLITFALNFLTHCTDEAKSHGSEMRNGYRGVIERKDNHSPRSSSTVRLFEGLNW